MNDASAAEIAAAEKPLFLKFDETVLADCIHTYKTWGSGPDILILLMMAIMHARYFEYDGMLKKPATHMIRYVPDHQSFRTSLFIYQDVASASKTVERAQFLGTYPLRPLSLHLRQGEQLHD